MNRAGRYTSSRPMSRMRAACTTVSLVTVAALGTSCTAKKSTSQDNSTQTNTANTGNTQSFGGASTLKDLNLAGFLAIDLPDSVTGKGTAGNALRLTASKSYEACKLRSDIRMSLSNLSQASQSVCMIQGIPGAKFGKKLNIDFSKMAGAAGGETPPGAPGNEGSSGDMPPPSLRLAGEPGEEAPPEMPGSMQFWADNSNPEKMHVYFCQDRKLVQHYEIAKVTDDKKVKGSVTLKMGFGDNMSFHTFMGFDSVTNPGRTAITIKERVDSGDMLFRRLLSMSLADQGVSRVVSSMSASGSSDGQPYDFTMSSSGAFSSAFGSVISVMSSSTDNSLASSSQSFFDGQSNMVDPEQHPAEFAPNSGKVFVAESSMPKALPADFKPNDFAPGSWDCSGTEDLAFDAPPENEMQGCQETWNEIVEDDCDQGFAPGESVTISDEEYVDAGSYEEVPVAPEPQ